MEGVLVTGTARADARGRVRAVPGADLRRPIEVDVPGAVRLRRPGHADPRRGRRGFSRLEDDLVDLEPLLRDAVVLALPFQPLCQDDCPGLCAECGARLADDPDHAHDEPVDPRWAALAQLTAEPEQADWTPDRRRQAGRLRPRERSNSGCPEAEDVAQQHAPPAFAVEGRRAVPGDLRQPRVRCEAPAAPRLRHRAASTARGPTVVRSSDHAGPLTTTADARVAALGDPVLDAELLERALTHRSYAYENGGLPTNERLEFLGDSVLGVVVTETLYLTHPDLSEGQLAKLRAAVVNARALAEVGRTHRARRARQARPGEDTDRRPRQGLDPLRHRRGRDRGGPPHRRLRRRSAQVVHLLFDPLIEAASATGRRPGLEDLPPGALRRARPRRPRVPHRGRGPRPHEDLHRAGARRRRPLRQRRRPLQEGGRAGSRGDGVRRARRRRRTATSAVADLTAGAD